jgi:replicative DNA helicase
VGKIENGVEEKNNPLSQEVKIDLKTRREGAIMKLRGLKGRLGIKDSSDGHDFLYIEKMIKVYKAMAGTNKLIVIVDFLNMVQAPKMKDKTEQESEIAGFLKNMATKYSCPVLCTVESTKDVINTKTTESSIKGSASIQFRSDLTLLMYSDYENTKDYEMQYPNAELKTNLPIVKVQISKNKMGSFRGPLFYKFIPMYAKFIECGKTEMDEWAEKIK